MLKQKEQVMQPVTMAILIAIVFLSELPSFSARINSSFPDVIGGNHVSPSAANTMPITDEDPPTYFIKIPVSGNVYSKGFYYVKIQIGSQTYKLDIDTGSDLTWFPIRPEGQDESQSMQYVRRDEPRCRDLLDSTTGEEEYKNGGEDEYENGDLCNFEIIYQDGQKSKGHLVTDTFALGSSISPTLAIGASSEPTTHGMLGLGKGKIGILSQLQEQGHFANIFGHCLSRNRRVHGHGFMFIGKDYGYPRCFTWVPMSSDSPHYSLTMAGLAYGHEQLLGSNNQAFVLDSGTTYTYLVDSLYKQLLSKVAEVPLRKLPGGDGKPPCWKDTKPFESIHHLRSRFSSSIHLRLQDGKALQILPENYLTINEAGDVCLGILNGHGVFDNFNLIGAISMQNVMIVYDNELQRIGWANVGGCSDPPVQSCH